MKHFLLLASFAAFTGFASTSFAADTATGDQISQMISGNTVQGSMVASGAYSEFYAADGSIKGKDYTGMWKVEGDTMCFAYGTDPANCWQASFDGDQVTWIKDGKADGTGTVVKGNPNNF